MSDQTAVAPELFSPEYLADPYPTYEHLRRESPVKVIRAPQGIDVWLVTRYEDARATLTDPRFSRDLRNASEEVKALTGDPEDPANRNLLTLDPPDHTRLRRLLQTAFTGRRVRELRPRAQAIVDGLLDGIAEHDELDLLASYCYPLPLVFICDLMGIPPEERQDFRPIVNAMIMKTGSEEEIQQLHQAQRDLKAYFVQLIARKRKEPGDDLLSALIAARDGDEKLNEDELVGLAFMLLIAGHETTVNLIATSVYLLLSHPEQLRKLQADPELLPDAIQEVLRFDGPAGVAYTVTTEPVELGGETIGAGQSVATLWHAVNRDPDRFPDPDRFDITRADNHHMGFGYGIHRCVGAQVARMEAEVAVGSLVRRYPDLELAVDASEIVFKPVPFFRALAALPIRLNGAR